MKYETRLRGNVYQCEAKFREHEGQQLVDVYVTDLQGKPIGFKPTEQELNWVLEECSLAMYAESRGIDY